MADPAIRIRGLWKRYGSVEAVRGVDAEVAAGEVFALLGPNGAGKTTIVEILEGHRHATAGEVRVLGHDPARGERAYRERIGIVLQSTGVEEYLTVRETVSLVAGYYLSDLLSRYRRHCPDVVVAVTEETPRFLEHLLINGELDVAIMVSNALGEPKALMSETLTRSASRV